MSEQEHTNFEEDPDANTPHLYETTDGRKITLDQLKAEHPEIEDEGDLEEFLK